MLRGVDGVEAHLERQAFAKQVEHGAHEFLHGCRPMNHQFAQPSQHAQRRDQAWKPKAMIAMQVRDEDVVQPAELDMLVAHLYLRALPAIDHVKFVPQIDYLRGGQVACGG